MKEMIRKNYERVLMEEIKKNGGKCDSSEDIWSNLKYLATKATRFDEEFYYLSLKIKQMLAYVADPDSRIEYLVRNDANSCAVEARFYWSGQEHYAGTGFIKRYTAQLFPTQSMTNEERMSVMESAVRSLAASRAYTDAGIGLDFYADSLDKDIERQEEYEEDILNKRKNSDKEKEKALPEIPSATEKKNAPRKKVEAPVEEAPVETAPISSPTEEISEEVKEEASSMTVEEARQVIVDCGTYAGNPLGSVYDTSPKTLIWLVNKGATCSEAARVIVMSDNDLRAKLA